MGTSRATSRSRKPNIIHRESSGKRIKDQGRARLLIILLVFALSFGALGVRLVEVMVVSNPMTARLQAPRNDDIDDEAILRRLQAQASMTRGDIVDRNGVMLATNLVTESLYATPRVMSNLDDVVNKLSKIFPNLDKKQLLSKLKDGKKNFVWIKRNLTPSEQQKVMRLGIPGLEFQSEQRRVYPYANMVAHVLGYVGVDNEGLAGIEKYFDNRLRGESKQKEPLALSMDMRVQSILYQELKAGVKEFSAIGGTGIVMDLHNNELLAMANLPDFDPHQPGRAGDAQKFNRSSLGVYEMGSTFKTFTVAMALDSGVIGMQDGFDASNPIRVSKFTISDTHPKKRWLSVAEIFAYSSNIGTVKMMLSAGKERQQNFLRKIGFMKPVEIELPEVAQPLYPREWKDINAMTISYGHGMSVTPLHLVRGIAAMVNGGKLEKLTLVKNGNGENLVGERVISEETSRKMRRLMRMVVEHGTGGKGEANGYRVGGKTGTAEKPTGGGYNRSAKIASFIGVFPADEPRYLVLVMIDEPRGTKATHGYATGGWIAAPIASKVIGRMGPFLGIPPVYEFRENDVDKRWVEEANSRFLHEASLR